LSYVKKTTGGGGAKLTLPPSKNRVNAGYVLKQKQKNLTLRLKFSDALCEKDIGTCE